MNLLNYQPAAVRSSLVHEVARVKGRLIFDENKWERNLQVGDESSQHVFLCFLPPNRLCVQSNCGKGFLDCPRMFLIACGCRRRVFWLPSVVFLIAAGLLIASTGCQRCPGLFSFHPPPPSLVLPITHPETVNMLTQFQKIREERKEWEEISSLSFTGKANSCNDVLFNSKSKHHQVAKFGRNILQLFLFSPGDFGSNVLPLIHLIVCARNDSVTTIIKALFRQSRWQQGGNWAHTVTRTTTNVRLCLNRNTIQMQIQELCKYKYQQKYMQIQRT